ncbi:MAG: hypothetical protein C5B49_12465 [Bdellovibrio sp.]|nr:MAG: hypothetical protein C5B49_12465 [Bdellovibrio sp.]
MKVQTVKIQTALMILMLPMPMLMLMLPGSQALATASCGACIDSRWEDQPAAVDNGWTFEFRFDYLNENQLRSGSGTISKLGAAANLGYSQEVEQSTLSMYYTLGLRYDQDRFALTWIVPVVSRGHTTNGNGGGNPWDGSSPTPGGGAYTSNAMGIGDLKLLGTLKNVFGLDHFNFTFGMKVATGATNQTGTSTDPTVVRDVPVDARLQLGTGTTDLIYILDYNEALGCSWSGFTQLQFQSAIKEVNNFRPGDGYHFNLGVRYFANEMVTPFLQLNTRWFNSDSGAAANGGNTGGTHVYVTPGANEKITETISLYQMVQLPIYEYVNGVQLTPQYVVTVGYQQTL